MPTDEEILKDVLDYQETLKKVIKVEEYNKTRRLYWSIISQIEKLTEEIKEFKTPRGPREDLSQQHDRTHLRALEKQKERLEKKLAELEESIKLDIEESKK